MKRNTDKSFLDDLQKMDKALARSPLGEDLSRHNFVKKFTSPSAAERIIKELGAKYIYLDTMKWRDKSRNRKMILSYILRELNEANYFDKKLEENEILALARFTFGLPIYGTYAKTSKPNSKISHGITI